MTDSFNVEVVMHQGSTLNLFLFKMVMDRVADKIRQEYTCTMMFADLVGQHSGKDSWSRDGKGGFVYMVVVNCSRIVEEMLGRDSR